MSTDTNKKHQNTQQRDNELLAELGIKPGELDPFAGQSTDALIEEQRRLDTVLKQLELHDKLETLAEKKKKQDAKRAEYQAKNREILMELARRAARMRGCSHLKGGTCVSGRSNPLPVEGGDADVYAIIKHQMPTGQWWCLCQRCGAEWWPEDPWTGKPATIIGSFTYEMALKCRTDNSPSKSAVFVFDDQRSSEQIEDDRWKPPVNADGTPAKDIYADPPIPGGGGALQPSRPVAGSR